MRPLRPSAARRGRPAEPLTPLGTPEHSPLPPPSSAVLRAFCCAWLGRPRRRTQRAASAIAASAAPWLPPAALCVGVASGQSPTEPIRRAVSRRRCLPLSARLPPYAVKPERPVSGGSTPTMTNASEARSLKPVQRDTISWESARYGTVDRSGWNLAGRRPFGLFPSFSLSSRRPCDPMGGLGRQPWARGPIPIFRKIHLYGKSKKSTHGHTKKKPTQPFFRTWPFFGRPALRGTEKYTWSYPAAAA